MKTYNYFKNNVIKLKNEMINDIAEYVNKNGNIDFEICDDTFVQKHYDCDEFFDYVSFDCDGDVCISQVFVYEKNNVRGTLKLKDASMDLLLKVYKEIEKKY